MARVSFDSGVLVALERGERSAWAWFRRAVERGRPPVVSAAAVAEVWRDGRTQALLARALSACEVSPLDDPLARAAGEALRTVGGGTVDAIVAATAASNCQMLWIAA